MPSQTRNVNAHIFARFRKVVRNEKYLGCRRIILALASSMCELFLCECEFDLPISKVFFTSDDSSKNGLSKLI